MVRKPHASAALSSAPLKRRSLQAAWSGGRIPMGAKFSAANQPGPEAHPASCTMRTGSLPGVKRLGRSVEHPPPSHAEVKETVELYLCSPYGPSWPVLGWILPLLFTTEEACKSAPEPVMILLLWIREKSLPAPSPQRILVAKECFNISRPKCCVYLTSPLGLRVLPISSFLVWSC